MNTVMLIYKVYIHFFQNKMTKLSATEGHKCKTEVVAGGGEPWAPFSAGPAPSSPAKQQDAFSASRRNDAHNYHNYCDK